MALREQSAAGVDGDFAADVRRAFVDHAAGLAFAAELQVLVVQELSRREAVMQLDLAKVFRTDACLLISLFCGDAGDSVDIEHRRVARRVGVRGED